MPDLSRLPKVDVLAASPSLAGYTAKLRTTAARFAIERMRGRLLAGVDPGDPVDLALSEALLLSTPCVRRVINGSGIILHTGLGRARLAPRALEAVRIAAENHADVELDLDTGKRGDRQAHVRRMLCLLTGAEDALVVNNGAAALALTLSALAKGGEVLLSRGQMVEIGGSFRMPQIIRASGCRLKEVGCTNKTRIDDFAEALSPKARAILRCHPSNFKVVGFTEEPSIAELSSLSAKSGAVLIDDVGSGCVVDTTRYGLPAEPILGSSLTQGVHVATASGDKLLGGPQAGLIIGAAPLVRQIARHPLARAYRIDKLTLAALSATLQLYMAGLEETIPTWRYLERKPEEVRELAETLAAARPSAVVAQGETEIGGGSVPGHGVPTFRCGIGVSDAHALARRLRLTTPSIVGRIEAGRVWLDPRTMEVEEVEEVAEILRGIA